LLKDFGYDEHFAESLAQLGRPELIAARVVRGTRRSFEVVTETGRAVAQLPGRMLQRNREQPRPVVGDWLALEKKKGRWLIAEVLTRRSTFIRRGRGRATEAQVIVANVDIALLLTGLDGDYNLRRIERYLALTWQSGAKPVVVLNKRDMSARPVQAVTEVTAIAGATPVHAISAKHGDNVAALEPYLVPATTIVLLGSSGVGKSTLANQLLGEDRQRVAEVRGGDDRGRHTTTSRELIMLPSGALLIDTPGLRELRLWQADTSVGIDEAFDDITALAQSCSFVDCSHGNEPDCAVRAALENGTLSKQRLASYLKLQMEIDDLERLREERLRADERGRSRRKRKKLEDR